MLLQLHFLVITLLFSALDASGSVEQAVLGVPRPKNSFDSSNHLFKLRHSVYHGTYRMPGFNRQEYGVQKRSTSFKVDDVCAEKFPAFQAKSTFAPIQRLRDRSAFAVDSIMAVNRRHSLSQNPVPAAWTIDNILAPNVTDKQTVLSFARMAIDAYYINSTCEGWDTAGPHFNDSLDFGWEGDGLRGHVFADENNSTVVISVKGTSKALWDGEGTTRNDKENDNLFGSCCCGEQSAPTSRQVCSCATSVYTCNSTCVQSALLEENRYYTAGKNIFANITALYPKASIIMTGHSLGGTVASLIALTYGIPAITFESVPDALAASRLGIPSPPQAPVSSSIDLTAVYHFGNTADPVYMGVCNGWNSLCSWWGYAFESQCHTGSRCVYDVVADKGWRVDIRKHVLRTVIDEVIEKYDDVPVCVRETDCVDCYRWKFL